MLKDNTVYNHPENEVLVKTNGDLIYIICSKESQQDIVIQKMINDNCILESYEEWDEDDDMKWILTYQLQEGFDTPVAYN